MIISRPYGTSSITSYLRLGFFCHLVFCFLGVLILVIGHWSFEMMNDKCRMMNDKRDEICYISLELLCDVLCETLW